MPEHSTGSLSIFEFACNAGERVLCDILDRAVLLRDRMERSAMAVSARPLVTPVVAAAVPEFSAVDVATLVRDCTDGPDESWLGLKI